MKPGYYSPHFTRLELVSSGMAARKGISNEPTEAIERNLERLCLDVLEPIRARFGPIRVTSGYRNPALNAAIGGSATSAHMDGRAADVQPLDPQVTLREVVGWLRGSPRLNLDQIIYEYSSWVHVGIAKKGVEPRAQVLMAFGGTGFMEFDLQDPRVV